MAQVAGNIDLFNQKVSSTFPYALEDGKIVLLSTMNEDGSEMLPADALQRSFQTGQHLGIFDTLEEADQAAEQIKQQQSQQPTSTMGISEGSPFKTQEQRDATSLGMGAGFLQGITELPLDAAEWLGQAGEMYDYKPGELAPPQSGMRQKARTEKFEIEEFMRDQETDPDFKTGSQLGYGMSMVVDPVIDTGIGLAPHIMKGLKAVKAGENVFDIGGGVQDVLKRLQTDQTGAVGDVEDLPKLFDVTDAPGALSKVEYPMSPEGTWYGEGTYKESGGEIQTMTPDEFLGRAKSLEIDDVARENIDDLKQHITEGNELDPLTLHDVDTSNVRASDGRHRALAAKELGIDEVPVVVYPEAKAGMSNPPAEDLPSTQGLKGLDTGAAVKVDEGGVKESFRSWKGKTEAEFIGKPRITSAANARDLVPSELRGFDELQPFSVMNGKYQMKMDEAGAAIYDGDKLIGSYNFGDTIAVDKKYRRRGVGEELVYQYRTKYPEINPATHRTKNANKLQKKVWRRIEDNNNRADYDENIARLKAEQQAAPTDPPAGSDDYRLRGLEEMPAVGSPKQRLKRAVEQGYTTKAYTGSTHDITEFDGSLSNPENDWGRGTYSSTSIDDVNANYAGEGPDLTNRIESRSERVAEELSEADDYRDAMLEEHGISLKDYEADEAGVAEEIARKELTGLAEGGVVYPLKIKTKDYAVIGGENPTKLVEPDFYEQAKKDVDRADYDKDYDYEDAINERRYELQDESEESIHVKVSEALRDTDIYNEEHMMQTIMEEFGGELVDGELRIDSIDDAIRRYVTGAYDDNTGDMISAGEISSQVIKNLGFDGVVDMNVNQKFGRGRQDGTAMEGVDPDTAHIITFPGKEHTVRSRNAMFDPKEARSKKILASAAGASLGLRGIAEAQEVESPNPTRVSEKVEAPLDEADEMTPIIKAMSDIQETQLSVMKLLDKNMSGKKAKNIEFTVIRNEEGSIDKIVAKETDT